MIRGFKDLPNPSPDIKFYKKVLNMGFSSFPERKENYERYKAAQRGANVEFLPIKADIENVSRCNYRCNMCQVSEWPKLQRAKDMTFQDFKTFIDSQFGLTEIKLQGMGEPLMGGDSYFKMIEYARSRHIWVRSSTNASLLHLKENYKRLIDSDICDLQVSVDGASKETYERIRRGGKFDMVRQNCLTLNHYASLSAADRTRMWVVVQKENIAELELFPELAANLGFKRITLSLDLTGWGQEQWEDHNEGIDAGNIINLSRAIETVEIGKNMGVETTFWCIDEKYVPGDLKKLCPWPFERTYISSDLRTVPCCMIANPDVSEFGDALNFETVWKGEAYNSFRQRHIDGDIPDICSACYDIRDKE